MTTAVADVRFSTRVARQSLRVTVVFSAALILCLLAERYYFHVIAAEVAHRKTNAFEARNKIILAEEILASSAVSFSLSGDPKWKARYLSTVPEIKSALAIAKSLASPVAATRFEKETSEALGILLELEQTAIDLFEGGFPADSANMFGSPRYVTNKTILVDGTNRLLSDIDAEAQAAEKSSRLRSLLLIFGGLAFSGLGFIWIWRRLNAALIKAEISFVETDQKYHAKLAETNKQLIKNSNIEQLGLFTATIAHELRNPLGAVRTSAFLIQRMINSSDTKIAKAFQRINHGVERCDALVGHMLQYSKSYDMQPKRQCFDDWLERAIRDMEPRIPKNIDVHCDLGTGAEPIEFDQERMSLALTNVLSNSILSFGDVTHNEKNTIVVLSRKRQDRIDIEISDNGSGIASEVLPNVFHPFFTTRSFGAGLGLATVKNILEQHKGGIAIESTEGQGTKVSLWLAA